MYWITIFNDFYGIIKSIKIMVYWIMIFKGFIKVIMYLIKTFKKSIKVMVYSIRILKKYIQIIVYWIKTFIDSLKVYLKKSLTLINIRLLIIFNNFSSISINTHPLKFSYIFPQYLKRIFH